MGKKTMDGLIMANVLDFADYLTGLAEDQELVMSRRRDPAIMKGHVKRWAGMRKVHAIPQKRKMKGAIEHYPPGKAG